MKKAVIAMLFLTFCVLYTSAALEPNPIVRVGLYYGSDSMISANLQNVDAHGYRFGFFDSTNSFISQFSSNASNRISMLKDKNLYYFDGKFYESDSPSGSSLIGAYHLELINNYKTATEAQNFVTSLNIKSIPAFVAVKNNTYKVRIGSYASLLAAQTDSSKYSSYGKFVTVGNSPKCVTVVNTANGKILFEYDNSIPLAVYPSLDESKMPLTWFKGYKYNGGFQYIRDGGNISIINFVPMQDYVKGVIPYEMSASWPIEALKAQSMCARTYALYNFGKHGKNFDICATTDCQVYCGANAATDNSNKAVDETYGMYILYKGKPINAVFHSSDGGATEDSENIWSTTLPYLRGVIDNNENLDSATNGRWSYEYSASEITNILQSKGYNCSKIVNVYVKERTKMGNVKTLTIVDSNGKEFNFSKEKARTILYSSSYKKYTHSQRYSVTRKSKTAISNRLYVNTANSFIDYFSNKIFAIGKNSTSKIALENPYVITSTGVTPLKGSENYSEQKTDDPVFIISGTGWGHNVGMSQYGAKALATKGKTAEDIIHFYYTDVDVFKPN